MDAAYMNLLYHTEIRWLSKGNVLKRVLDHKEETTEFLKLQKRTHWHDLFENHEWITRLCYLCDIFERLNTLNLSLQGKDSNIMDFVDKLSAFQAMLDLWRNKINSGRITMFSHLCCYVEDCEISISEALQNDIATHLQSLKDEFSRYFPETTKSKFNLVRNPFLAKIDDCIPDNHDAAQEDFIKLVNNSGAQTLFSRVDLPSFWSSMLGSYPIVSQIALKLLMPFPSTYLCEAAFSSMLVIKTKARNRLDVKPDLRCCLAITQPRIQKLVDEKQHQKSH
ncbi:Zinc finger BED domain-containing protein 5-like [Oopsacas minuta]|uniref:Zinc finger BED domain-containing protein 5-like n=1 Tax=Oopsacas minuta TaxID=111878 RepID=A0AAV7JGS7_9METZ|nr:Zinc finger BED domain-containing protein 5-like [Oopsacas minuta]